jgi:hypothetical protein
LCPLKPARLSGSSVLRRADRIAADKIMESNGHSHP